MRSEKELISHCKKGRSDAQKELFQRFAPRVKGICLRYVQNNEDAGDLLQEVFIKVYTGIHLFRGDSSLGTWITSITVKTAINFLRKRNKDLMLYADDTSALEVEDETSEEQEPYGGLTPEQVLKQIQNLPVIYRTILNLYVIDGLTHKEIAAEMGVSEGTSKSQLSRARKQLIDQLKKEKLIPYEYQKI